MSGDYDKVVFEISRGHPTPNWGYLESIRVKILKFRNLEKLYTKLNLLLTCYVKRFLRPPDFKIGGIWGHLGSKSKYFQTKTKALKNNDKLKLIAFGHADSSC